MSWAVLAIIITACTPAQKKPFVATALDNTETRRESFEAALRVLDRHPKYVEELFHMSRRHPMFDQFLEVTAQHLHEEVLARRAAKTLAAYPDGMHMTMIAIMDEVKDKPATLEALARAIEQRPDETVRIIVQRDMAMRKTVRALVEEVQRNPHAERAFIAALIENSEGTARVLTRHPEEMGMLFKAFGKAGVKRGGREFELFLSRLAD